MKKQHVRRPLARAVIIVFAVLVSMLAVGVNSPVATAEASPSTDAAGRPLGAQPAAPAAVPTPPTAPLVHDVLPGKTAGDQALAALSPDVLSQVATQNGQSVGRMKQILADPTVFLDKDGKLFYEDPVPPAAPQAEPPVAQGPFPNSQTFLLHSRAGSNRTLYLDFNGYNLPAGTAWRGGAAYTASAWDTDGSPSTFGQSELDAIQSVWQRVSEDYAPFDIDVTTQDPGLAAIDRSSAGDTVYGTRAIITNSPSTDFCSGGCGGIAYVGVIDEVSPNHEFYQPAWVFGNSLGQSAKNIAEAASHEVGHNMGLSHDGRISPSEAYYQGHGDWAPIMGVGYYRPVSQWSRGEYTSANNTEDDYVVANANGVALIPDEAGCAVAATDGLVQNAVKTIASEGDCDAFRYDAPCSGTYTITTSAASVSPDLSVQMNLWNWNGAFISNSAVQPTQVNSDVESDMGETTTLAMTGGSAYTIVVFPLANGTASTNWTNYGNRGRFSVKVSTPCGADQFAASSIGGPFDTRTVNNAGYTSQPDEVNPTCGDTSNGLALPGSTNTAWWNWTAPANGTVTIDTIGSSYDTVLAVYTGSAVNSLSQVGCSDDASGVQSILNLAVTSGVTYRIQVDGYNGATGTTVVSTRGCVPNTNNTFACAGTLTSLFNGTGSTTGTNVGYNTEGGEPAPSCIGASSPTTAWWNWTAPGTGNFTFDTIGSNFDTVLSMYTGSAVNGLTGLACNDDGAGVQSQLSINATAGSVYRIQVTGYGGASGNITLHVTDNRPILTPGNFGAVEGDSGTKVFNIPITMSAPSPTPVTVQWGPNAVACVGCATPGVDFVDFTGGTVTFAPGETTKTVQVQVIGDTVKETPLYLGEWFFVRWQGQSVNARLDVWSFYGVSIGIIADESTDH